ncbi:hypothetical protein EVG20_g10958 [Dentipellis fragilis]|uniref:NACHT domain-containing protein n=1 Tax=Dentipellis fragilis TaxID=205917 RepID=A0A4Y9XN83_9AGAM|nr:hypothetical protein EVG20_g10958 [Dentipellis fragilis]
MTCNTLSYNHQFPQPENPTGEPAISAKMSRLLPSGIRRTMERKRKSPSAQTSTIAPDDDDGHDSLIGAHGENGVRELLIDATKMIIKTVREVSDVFPPLKATAGGLCSVIESIDIMNRNVEETAQLINHMEQLVRDYASEWAQHTNTNNPLKEGMVRLSEEIKLQCTELEQKAKKHGWIRFFQGARDAAFLQDKGKAIREALETFDRVILKSIKDDVTSIKEHTSVIQSNQNDEALRHSLEKLERYCSNSASFTASIGDSSSITRRACTTGTRVKVLDEILDWLQLTGNEQLFWLTGHAGSGKTTIAFTICDRLQERHPDTPLVSYFCSRQLDSGATQQLLPTLCRYLAGFHNVYAKHLADAIDKNFGLLTAHLPLQLQKLLVEPWKKCSSLMQLATVIVIDALDENIGGYTFLRGLLTAVNTGKLKGIKFLITSRTDQKIAEYCHGLKTCRLQDISIDEAQADIKTYLTKELQGCNNEMLDKVAQKADGLFMYAATIVRVVQHDLEHSSTLDLTLRKWLYDHLSAVNDQANIPQIYQLYHQIITC